MKRLRAKVVVVAHSRPEIRELVGEALTEAGAVVIRCSDGMEALDWIVKHGVHALVAGLAMPIVCGRELLRRVRALDDPRKRALLAIALADEGADEEPASTSPPAGRAGGALASPPADFDVWLPPPVDVARLIDLLATRIAAPAPS
jgi:CheY-like chemotaxis protein